MVDLVSPIIEDSPFKKSAKEIEAIQYPGADKRNLNGFDIIASRSVDPEPFIREMSALMNVDQDSSQGTSNERFSFSVKVFISKDDSYLKKLFENTDPFKDEVCIFLEDNSDDIVSWSSAYVKIGSDFRNELAKLKAIGEGQTDILENERFQQHFQGANIDFTNDQIEELITTGQVSNITQSVLIGVFQSIYMVNIALSPLFNLVAKGIFSLTGLLKQHVKFQPYHWDPIAKKPDPSDTSEKPKMIDNPDFEPVLFPYSNTVIDGVSGLADEEMDTLIQSIKSSIQKMEQQFTKELDAYIVSIKNSSLIPQKLKTLVEPIKAVLEKVKRKVHELVNSLLVVADKLFTSLAYLGKKLLNTINAFYCGLWNGFMDSVIGIIDLVGFLVKAFGMQGDFMKHGQTKIPQAFELLDEFIQNFNKLDFSKIAAEISEQIMKIDILAFASKVSMEKVAYFFGAVVGFIVEILIGIFFTGGTEAVYATINKLITNSAKLLKTIQTKIVKFFGKSISQLKDDILLIVAKIIEFIKKGTDGIINAIRVLFEEIINTVKLSAETIKEIMRLLKISKADLKKLDDLGFSFVSFQDKIPTACKIIRDV